MCELAELDAPARRTKTEAIAAGNAVVNGEVGPDDSPYTDVDIYTTLLSCLSCLVVAITDTHADIVYFVLFPFPPTPCS